jgi:hypothetical protein
MSVRFNSIENSCNPIVIRATRQIPSWPGYQSGFQFTQNPLSVALQPAVIPLPENPPVKVDLFHTIVMAYSGYERDSVPSGIQSPGTESTHPK